MFLIVLIIIIVCVVKKKRGGDTDKERDFSMKSSDFFQADAVDGYLGDDKHDPYVCVTDDSVVCSYRLPCFETDDYQSPLLDCLVRIRSTARSLR